MEGTMQPTPPTPPTPPTTPAPPKPKSNNPLIAMILSIVGVFCCGLLSIAGLILGYIELGKINRGETSEEGRGMAKAAVIIGIIALALWVIGIIIAAFTGGVTFYFGT